MFHKLGRTLAALLALGLLTSLGPAQAPATKPPATKSSKSSKSKLVDINSASKEALDALPGIGAYSQKIIDGRPYNSKRDLVTRNVLPQGTYDGVKDQIIAHRSGTKKSATKGAALAAPNK